MKMTIITDDQNNILGAVQGHSLSDKQGSVEASVSFGPGHVTHMVEVDDDLATINDLDDFQNRLNQHLQQHLAKP
ncbi:hypothetical protein D0T25_16120 [Duganella sp. BJB488]|uniref:hypothetical protein n=1 Tax=unclassified Duganella TaxID=2636909 RepID=UPI000E34EBF8|nr:MULTISPECIES: hypothetical protein [unclassified Duganella]NVD74801.1 hypothetical protein [Duganella sp. BJB1802]RFP20172.1 hypothetical protein D0T26_12855 [Duganella sp. BJB489]RFP21380.1 hypothetical protein D0T25_16120 [Duganella sp. BJB488]RFP33521.1 hypothetical protein D0T24_19815 [Duganella sp. BJB480]